MDTVSVNKEVTQSWKRKELFLGILAVAITVALCVAAVYYKDALLDMAHLAGYSLLGVLLIAFVAGSVVSITAMPVPYILVVFTIPSVVAVRWGLLAPVWVGMISALGASLGQLLTFMIGYGGRSLYQKLAFNRKSGFYSRAMGWARHHGSWAVFIMSAIFNPLHLPMTFAIAALRYPPWKFFLFSMLGNSVKSLIIAFCGYFGLSSLFRFLGI